MPSDYWDHKDDFDHFDYIDAMLFTGCPSKEALETIQLYFDRWNRQMQSLKEIHAEVEEDEGEVLIYRVGTEEGDKCNRQGCPGVIEICYDDDLSCSCHINPPCTRCTTGVFGCKECGWRDDEEA